MGARSKSRLVESTEKIHIPLIFVGDGGGTERYKGRALTGPHAFFVTAKLLRFAQPFSDLT